MTDTDPVFGEADLTNCDREPIHIPGSIQPHGAILALAPGSLQILQAGGDTLGLLGRSVEDFLGKTVTEWLSPEHNLHLTNLIATSGPLSRPVQAFLLPRARGPGMVKVTIHLSGSVLIMEFEPASDDRAEDSITLVQSMVRSVQVAENHIAACQAAAELVRAAAGFDRVMATGKPLDMSQTTLRSVSPIHLEYLGAVEQCRYPDRPDVARIIA